MPFDGMSVGGVTATDLVSTISTQRITVQEQASGSESSNRVEASSRHTAASNSSYVVLTPGEAGRYFSWARATDEDSESGLLHDWVHNWSSGDNDYVNE